MGGEGESFFWLLPYKVTANWWPHSTEGHSPDLALSTWSSRQRVVTAPLSPALRLSTFPWGSPPPCPHLCKQTQSRWGGPSASCGGSTYRCFQVPPNHTPKRHVAVGQAPVPGPRSGQVDKSDLSFSWLARKARAAGRDGARPPWLRATGEILGGPQGPPGGRPSPARAWSQGLLRTPKRRPAQARAKVGAEEREHPTGGQGIQALPRWPSARPFHDLGLSFFDCTARGQPAKLEELQAQDQNQSHAIVHTLAQPLAKCHLTATSQPPHSHLHVLRLSCPHFTTEEAETHVCTAIGLGRSRG